MKQLVILSLLQIFLACSAALGLCSAADEGWQSVGVMEGIPATQRKSFFHLYEAVTTYGLPWSLRSDNGWGVALQINAAAGVIHVTDVTGFIGSIGPGVIFDKDGKGLALEMGSDINLLSKYKFRSVDLNENLLFEAHVGAIYRFESGPGISYRFRHLSNGGMGAHGDGNTGLDLHMFGVNWMF